MKSYCIFILVLIIGILQSCDQVGPLSTDVTFDSENIIKEDGTIIKKMPLTEVPDIIENLTAISGKSIGSTSKIKYNNVRINLDSIVEVINLDKGSNYTLEMRVKGAPSNHIYNLVIHRSVSGILEAPYVIGYEIDPKFMRAFMESEGDLSQFVGEYHFYTYDQFFKDSKAGIVGESSDCGGGYTGGTSGPPIAPGSTFTQSYDGRTVEAIFSNSTMGGTYNFSSTIHTENGAQTHVATASSGVVTFESQTPNANFTITTTSSTTSVNVSTNTNTNTGSGAPCSSSSQIKDSGIVEFAPCPDSGSPTKKSVLYGKSSDCPSPEGGLALRGYDRAIQKVFYFLDSSLSWGELNFLEDNNGFPEILVSFFRELGINEESKGSVNEIIDSAINGSIISVAPLIKYPDSKAAQYKRDYPKLTEYLMNQLPKVAEIPKIVNAIHEFTKLPIDQIKKELQWDEGPELNIAQLDNYPGCSICDEDTVGFFDKPDNPNKIFLDVDYVNQLENGILIENDNDAAIFFIGTTILHEYVHYGDYSNGFDYPGEEGRKFEITVYGENVHPDRARLILNRLNN